MNYFISYEWCQRILDELMARRGWDESRLVETFYVKSDRLRTMSDNGMLVGSHGISHRVLSKLAVEEQEHEISASFEFLEKVTGVRQFRSFSYPHGGFHTFTDETERLLTANGCRFAFNVEARDIAADDLRNRPQALPRYNCNMFPHGSASIGQAAQ